MRISKYICTLFLYLLLAYFIICCVSVCHIVFLLLSLAICVKVFALLDEYTKLHVGRSKSTVCFCIICEPYNHFMTNLVGKQIYLRVEERKSVIFERKSIKRE